MTFIQNVVKRDGKMKIMKGPQDRGVMDGDALI